MCESTFVSSLPTHDPSALSRYFFRCGATARGCDANVYVDAAGSLIPVDILPCMRKRWQYTDEHEWWLVVRLVGRGRRLTHTLTPHKLALRPSLSVPKCRKVEEFVSIFFDV